jgi:hypothetical protein
MNTPFLDFLSHLWFYGGILLIPFNSFTIGYLICVFLNLKYDIWVKAMERLWIFQIIWNLLFFSTATFLYNGERAKISYTVTPASGSTTETEWAYHFYDNRGREIADDSEQATPFQKLISASNPIGLDLADGYHDLDDYGISLQGKLNALSSDEVRGLIDRYNAQHDTPPLNRIACVLGASLISPFLIIFPEALILGTIFCFLKWPISTSILMGTVFGPSIYKIAKASRS